MRYLISAIKYILIGVLFGIVIVFFERQQFYWGLLIILFVFFYFYEKIKNLENASQRINKSTGGITHIIDFNISFDKAFFKSLQKKMGYNDLLTKKIEENFASVRVKMENYENNFIVGKSWVTKKDKESYFEDNDIDYLFDRSYEIWRLDVGELQSDQGVDKANIFDILLFVYSWKSGEFIIYINSYKFKKSDKVFYVDELEVLSDEAILFRLKPYDFEMLEQFHQKEPDSPDTPGYYYPTDDYKRYSNWLFERGERNRAKESGIFWTLNWYDFTGEILSKRKK